MQSVKDRNTSLVQNKDAQKEVLDFIIQSFYCSPKDSEELKTAIIIANDNTSKTPDADRWFIEGVFATLRHLTKEGGKNGDTTAEGVLQIEARPVCADHRSRERGRGVKEEET